MKRRNGRFSLKAMLAMLLIFCMVFGMTANAAPGDSSSSTNVAKKDGTAEEYTEGQLYHIDILVEAEYEYTLSFKQGDLNADHADINIEKIWDVANDTTIPDSVTVDVTATVGSSSWIAKTVTLTADNNWTTTLENMPLQNSAGNDITYSVDESAVSASGYYKTVVTDISNTVDDTKNDVLTYTEDGRTIKFYFDSTAPHINVDGDAYGQYANWVKNSDGTYSLTFTYTNPETKLTYLSIWKYDPANKEYTYISDDYMEVDDILYVTYTDLNGDPKILYDKADYVTWATAVADNKNASYYNYIEQADTNRADQEFWSTNRAIADMPEGTEIIVGYAYTYGYYDKFGDWHSYSSTAKKTFDTSSEEFSNVCGEAKKTDTQRGYDVVLQLSDADVYVGDGVVAKYDVDITNTTAGAIKIGKEITNAHAVPTDANTTFEFVITLAEYNNELINGTFDATYSDGTSKTVTFNDGVATVTLKAGETVTINDLPAGVNYSVTEKEHTDYTAESTTLTGSVGDAGVTFNNTYLHEVFYGNLVVSKDVTHSLGEGYNVPSSLAFSVNVSLGADAAGKSFDVAYGTNGKYEDKTSVTADESGILVLTLKAGQDAIIYNIPEGTQVTVSEPNPGNGFTAHYYPANGKTTIVADNTVAVTVTNTYIPESVTAVIDISGTKTVEGTWGDQVFTFYLQKYVDENNDGVYEWKTIATDTADKDNPTIDFDGHSKDKLTFDEIGTYSYQVIEANHGQTIAGVTYDDVMHTFDVVVTDTDMDGKLEAVIRSSHGTTNSGFTLKDGVWENDNIDFKNYINKGSEAYTIMIQKALDNLVNSPEVSLEGYTFKLYTADAEWNYDTENPIATTDPTDGSGETHVTQIYHYDNNKNGQTETYYYVLKETASNIAGMNDSTEEYKFIVHITHNNDGTLTKEVELVSNFGTFESVTMDGTAHVTYPLATFTNTYQPDSVTVEVPVTKNLTGRDIKDGEFEFAIYKVTDYNNGVANVEDEPFAVITNTDNTKFTFELSKVGTYYYQIAEVNHGQTIDGVTYDDAKYYIRVVVSDNKNGALEATCTFLNAKEITFTNTYKAEATEINLFGTKILSVLTEGVQRLLSEFTFSFQIVEVDESGNSVAGGIFETVDRFESTNADNSGVFRFSSIKYNEEGTHYYQIREVIGNAGGVVYDKTLYTVKVEVTDNEKGSLVAKQSITKTVNGVIEDVGSEGIVYTNTYSAKGVTLHLTGHKTLTAHDESTLPIDAGQFCFDAAEANADGTLVVDGKSYTVTNHADGTFTFDGLTFDAAGTFYYVIDEAEGSDESIKYDTTEYLLKVVVTDDGKGALVATPSLTINGDEANALTFNNTQLYPDLAIEKFQAANDGTNTKDKLEVFENDVVTYEIIVTNTGEAKATDVKISDVIPEGLTLVDGSISDGGTLDSDGETITWTVDSIATGESAVVSFQVRIPEVDKDTTWKNVATFVYGNDPTDPEEPEESNEVEIEEGYLDLDIEKFQAVNDTTKTKDKLEVFENDMVTYYLKVTNAGSQTAANVVVTDDISELIEDGFVVESIENEGSMATDNVITWNLGELLAGESVEVSFTVVVPDVSEDTEWDNMGIVTYDDTNGNPEEEPSNEVEIKEGVPNVTIKKTQSVNDKNETTRYRVVEVNDVVTYRLTIENNGTEDAINPVITDEIPDGLALVKDSISDGGIETDGVITWTLDHLAVGEKVTVSFKVTVPEVEDNAHWINIGTVDYDNNPEDKVDSNEVEIGDKISSPKTGDINSYGTWFLLMSVGAGILLFGRVAVRRRRVE